MIVDLLTKRFHNYVQLYPQEAAAAELHNHDFMDMIYRGWMILEKAARKRNGRKNPLCQNPVHTPLILNPIDNNEVIMNRKDTHIPVVPYQCGSQRL